MPNYKRITITIPEHINTKLNELSENNMRTKSNMISYLIKKESLQ